jgi:membrane protein DedA with SNARE-associated domain
MLPVVRTFISVPAGVARMSLWRFLAFSVLGAIPWTLLLVWAGVALGDNWTQVKETLRGLDYLVAAAVLALVALFVWRHVRR